MSKRTLSLVFVGLVACGDGSDAGGGASTAQTTGCTADNRKDVYAPGLAKSAGDLTVKVTGAVPAPPVKGMNELTLELTDSAGAVDGATVNVAPFMPDHGHGSTVTPVVAASGGGRYTVTKIYLAMAGLWKITVGVQRPGGALQEAAFQFCVDG